MIKILLQYVQDWFSNLKTYYTESTFKHIIILLFLFLTSTSLFAQGGTCSTIEPFCAGAEGLIFPNCNNQDPNCTTAAEPGPDYDCLSTQPYPAWFYLQIDLPGSLDFEIVQNTQFDVNGNPIGTGLDVDFIAWGPFAQGDDLCDYSQLQSFNEIGCSYSTAPIENFSIANGLTGEIYVLLITNYNQSPGFIKLIQTGGTGSTDCNIVFNCGVDIDGGDQTYCGVNSVTLTTTITGPVETYEWYKDNVLIAGQNSSTLNVTETALYKVIVDGTQCDAAVESEALITLLGFPCNDPICTSIDFEENFGVGTGRVCIDPNVATTTYVCNQFTQVDDGEYSISNISTGLNTGWHVDMEDHTEGDVDGRMLFVNAAFAPGEFYRRTITLSPDSDFSFNAWITTVYDTDTAICPGSGIPANVRFRIEDPNGVLITETNTGDIINEANPNWHQFSIAFNTGSNVDIQLVLINNSIGGCGNDLAIDDITLTKEGNAPVVVTPPDLDACDQTGNDEATFDLEVQNPIILDGQDPLDFNITYHLNQGDAELNLNAIATPNAYQNTSNPQTIYVRIEKALEPSCFSIVEFDLVISGSIVLTTGLSNSIELCSTSVFPDLDATPTNPGIDLTLVSYLWTDSSGNTVSTAAIFTPTSGGVYTVVVTYPPLCGEETFTVDIIVFDPAGLDLGPDQSICEGDVFEIIPTLTGDITDITYLWSPGGEITPTIFVSNSGIYSLEITTNSLCTSTDSIEISFSENPIITLGDDFNTCYASEVILDGSPSNYDPLLVTYIWTLNGTVLSGETNPTINAAQYGYGTFEVVVSFGNCSSTASITIGPSNDIEFDLGENFETCLALDVILNATPSNYDPALASYEWSLNGSILVSETSETLTVNQYGYGTFSVVVTVGGCSNTDSIIISPSNDIEFNLGENIETCFDQNVILNATPSNYDPTLASYEWSLNGSILVSETSETLTVNQYGYGTFSVVVTVGGCSNTDSIIISPSNDIEFDLGENRETCLDQAEILDATPSNYEPSLASFEWSQNGIVLSSETTATLTVNPYGYGTFSVVVTVGGCSNSDSITIIQRSDLAVTLGEDFTSCRNESQTLSASTSEEGASFEWFLNGDSIPNETGNILEIVIPSDAMGTQTYSVVISLGECTGTDSVDISLYDVENCVISQGLTPNNDGYNDFLDLSFLHDRVGIGNLQIFNRYGTLVFEMSNYVNEWGGQSKDGNELPTGTYYYVINLLGNDPVYGQQASGWIYINREK